MQVREYDMYNRKARWCLLGFTEQTVEEHYGGLGFPHTAELGVLDILGLLVYPPLRSVYTVIIVGKLSSVM